MARARSLWRNVWCSSHHCLNSRGNLVVFRSSQFGNTERSSKGLGSILSRSCRPARAGGTLHVFWHPHMHVPEPLCGSKVTVCSRVALLADILLYLNVSKHGGLGYDALDHPLGFVDQAVEPCQTNIQQGVSWRHFVAQDIRHVSGALQPL